MTYFAQLRISTLTAFHEFYIAVITYMLRQSYSVTTRSVIKSSTNLCERTNAVMRRRRDPLCTKLKTRLQFLGTVPLLTGADRMQDRPWTPCCSRLSFSLPHSVAPFASPFFALSLQFHAPLFVLALLPPFAAPRYVMAPGRRHSSRRFLASSCPARTR